MARAIPPSPQSDKNPSGDDPVNQATWEVELLRVLVSRKGMQVDAQWAIHPQLKQDLLPNEWQEVVDLMAKATDIVGTRFSKALTESNAAPSGNA